MKIDSKKWIIIFLGLMIFVLVLIGGLIYYVDPYFHFHEPRPGISYNLHEERYQNDGIVKNFSYDALLTGSSTSSNYKASDVNRFFDANSVKVTYLGGFSRETAELIETAINHNSNLKKVIRSFDHMSFLYNPDEMKYDLSQYPLYLYDDNPLNDIQYIENKAVLKEVYDDGLRTLFHIPMTSFDEYSNWGNDSQFGKDIIDGTYVDSRPEKQEEKEFTKEDLSIVEKNVNQNFLDMVKENPNIEFYIIIPPASIYYFDSLYINGNLQRQLEAEKQTITRLLGYENLHIFSFMQDTDFTTNLDNFKDVTHFNPAYQTEILKNVSEGKYEINLQNCNDYFEFMEEFYGKYNYDDLFE